jgi:hypothetical protein
MRTLLFDGNRLSEADPTRSGHCRRIAEGVGSGAGAVGRNHLVQEIGSREPSWLCPCEIGPALRSWVVSTRGWGMSARETFWGKNSSHPGQLEPGNPGPRSPDQAGQRSEHAGSVPRQDRATFVDDGGPAANSSGQDGGQVEVHTRVLRLNLMTCGTGCLGERQVSNGCPPPIGHLP